MSKKGEEGGERGREREGIMNHGGYTCTCIRIRRGRGREGGGENERVSERQGKKGEREGGGS